MQPEILFDDWWDVETTYGTWSIPVSVCGNPVETEKGKGEEYENIFSFFQDYVEGEVHGVSKRLAHYGVRLSMPGYLDCTEWSVFPSQQEALQFLQDQYDVSLGGLDDSSEDE